MCSSICCQIRICLFILSQWLAVWLIDFPLFYSSALQEHSFIHTSKQKQRRKLVTIKSQRPPQLIPNYLPTVPTFPDRQRGKPHPSSSLAPLPTYLQNTYIHTYIHTYAKPASSCYTTSNSICSQYCVPAPRGSIYTHVIGSMCYTPQLPSLLAMVLVLLVSKSVLPICIVNLEYAYLLATVKVAMLNTPILRKIQLSLPPRRGVGVRHHLISAQKYSSSAT